MAWKNGLAFGARVAALLAAVLACAATSAPQYRYVRAYPNWSVPPGVVHTIGCARAQIWVSKTGKEGIGISILTSTKAASCHIAIESLAFEVGGELLQAGAMPPGANVSPDDPIHFYLPLGFDNESAWNRGDNRGRFVIGIRGDAQLERIQLTATQSRPGPHLKIPYRAPRAEDANRGPIRTITPNGESGPLRMVPENEQ